MSGFQHERRIFVDSMSDLFHEDVPDEVIDRVFAVMALTPQHTYQVLTKRPERMRDYFAMPAPGEERASDRIMAATYEVADYAKAFYREPSGWPLPNVWLGVSVEDQERADERIPHLLSTPAAVRFLSMEPLLGPVEFSDVSRRSDAVEQLGRRALAGIDWVIVGGESGPHARPFDIAWARSLRDQCQQAGVAFFLKQLGAHVLDRHTTCADTHPPEECWPDITTRVEGHRVHLRHSHGSNADEWPEDLRVREFPRSAVSA